MKIKHLIIPIIAVLILFLWYSLRSDNSNLQHDQTGLSTNGSLEKDKKANSAIHSSGGNAGTNVQNSDEKISIDITKSKAVTAKKDFMAPRISPDGIDILCTKGKYRGLYIVTPNTSEIKKISDLPGVGYNARWSDDGNYIIAEYDDNQYVFNRYGEEVAPDSVDLKPTNKFYAKDGVIYQKNTVEAEKSETDNNFIKNDGDNYYSPKLSPDQSLLAYNGLSSGIFIKNLSSGELVSIGNGSHVNWLPDSSGIIYSYTQDDGQKIIEGDIYFAYADGSKVINLTKTPDVIESKPFLSTNGKQLSYEVDGQIFTVDIVIK